MNKENKMELARWAVNYAIKHGADDSSVTISKQRNVEIQHRDGKLEKIQESTSNSLDINIYANNRYTGHSTCDLKKISLEKFIREAVAMTKYLSEDKYRKLPDPELYKGVKDIDLQIVDPAYSSLSSEKRIEIAREIEETAHAVSDKVISATAGCGDSFTESVQVHSNGFMGERISTSFYAGAEATVEGAEGKRPEDWYYASCRHFNQLPSAEFLGTQAGERAMKKIGQEKVESAKIIMLVENRAASRLFYAMRAPLSGRALQQKASFLEGKLNQKIASEKLTIIDDPFIKKALGSRLFDGEGIAAKVMPVIEKGVLKNYFIDTYYGRKLEMSPTTGSASNTIFELGSQSMEEMVKQIGKGILITSFLGGNSNSTTGDFSFGIQGFLIENGQIVKPVNEMNISGNLAEFWNMLVAVGNDPYPYSSMQMPSLMFDGIQFSGI